MSPICSSETSTSRCSGTSIGSASTFTSFVDLREDAALLDAGRLAVERQRHGRVDRLVEADFLQVDVRDAAADGVLLVVLEHRGVRLAALDDDVEHGVAGRPRVVSAARRSRSAIAIATGSSRP